jgi:hypothetical protein
MNEGHSGAYRPLTSFSFYLNALITGKEAWGFRLVNILFYGLVCLLVFEVLKKYSSKKTAFWGALIFTVLPIHTEAVNNIVGRGEILSLGFVLFALLLQFRKKWELSAMMFLLALLSKEIATVGLPILMYALLMGDEKKDIKFGTISFYVLVTICYLFLRSMVLGNEAMGNNASMVENPLKFMSSSERITNAFSLVPFGLGKVIFPVHLSYDYSFNQLKSVTRLFDLRVLTGMLLMILSLGSLFTKLRKNTLWIFGHTLFWGSLAITGNFIFPVGTIFGERLWFWPSLGLIFIFIQLLCSCRPHTFFARRNISPASKFSGTQCLRSIFNGRHAVGTLHNPVKKGIGYVALLIIVLMSLRTFVRNIDWLSQERLFIHDAEYAKDSVLVQSNAAAMYLIKRDFIKGEEYLNKAEMIYPKYPELINNRGMYYLLKGETEKAKAKFEECLVVKPEFYLCEGNLNMINQDK